MNSISIHAPAKGATSNTWGNIAKSDYFNPRTREGCDISHILRTIRTIQISIHAPAKGATYGGLAGFVFSEISIHAPAKGAT